VRNGIKSIFKKMQLPRSKNSTAMDNQNPFVWILQLSQLLAWLA
jgi:hypothetical protein